MNNFNIGSNKNVLIISPTFPPQADVGGLRVAIFSKYLPQYGWNPIILTRVYPKNDLTRKLSMHIEGVPSSENICEVTWGVDNEKKVLQERGIIGKLKSFFCPEYYQPAGLIDVLVKEGENCIKNRDINIIYATSPHLSCLTIAKYLSKKFSIPWVADFRDIIEQDKASSLREKFLHFRLYYRRKVILKSAFCIITVSEYNASVLKSQTSKKVYIIPNGYDPTLFNANEHHQSKKFTIVYMGRLLDEWQRNPKPFFEALDRLIIGNEIDLDKVDVLFYGTEVDLLTRLVKNYKCQSIVKILPRVDYREVPTILQNSCINLNLTTPGSMGVLPTKVFEYLAVKRPILSIPNDKGALSELIKKTNSGVVCNNINEIASVLKNWYLEWSDTGTVKCLSDNNEVLKYSREQQTEELAKILNQIVEKKD